MDRRSNRIRTSQATPLRNLVVRATMLLARAASAVAFVTPVWIGYLVADAVGHWMFWRFGGYRESVISNLSHVYRDRLSAREIRQRARWVFRVSARNFWDLTTVPHFSTRRMSHLQEVLEGSWQTLEDLLAEGRGVIVVTGHLGAFDFVGQYFIDRFKPLALTAPTVNESLFTAVTNLRSSRGGRLAVAGPDALRKIIAELKDGGMVVMVADRDFTDSGAPIDFFGTPTRLPSGPVKLARQFGSPIVPVFTYRRNIKTRERRFGFTIGEPIWVEKTASREHDLEAGMRRVAAALERAILRSPEQWVMFQSVWKPSPAGAVGTELLPEPDAQTEVVTSGAAPAAISSTIPVDDPIED